MSIQSKKKPEIYIAVTCILKWPVTQNYLSRPLPPTRIIVSSSQLFREVKQATILNAIAWLFLLN